MMRKPLLLLIPLFLFSFNSQAQFKKLLKKEEHKAIRNILGDTASEAASSGNTPSESQNQAKPQQTDPVNHQHDEEVSQTPPKSKPIDFPVAGEEVSAMHGIYEWIVDTAAIANKIAETDQGKYAFDLAREKGLKGTNEQIFQQMLEPENQEIMEEIDTAVEKKFPQKKTPKGYRTKEWQNSAWGGEATLPAGTPTPDDNPAWGGISVPSLYFSTWGGDFSTWITDRYIKSELRSMHDGRPTIMGTYGLQAAEIIDLEKGMTYSIGSVFGVKFTKVGSLDKGESDSATFLLLHTIGIAQKFWPVPGIKTEPGPSGMFGPYHTVSERLIIPVRPFTDPNTGKVSNALLVYHDALSGRDDAGPDPNHNHYDPSYKIIYQYYFTHDLDKELPSGFFERYKAAGFKTQGFCIGTKIEDEKGNAADYRLTHVQSGSSVDKGQFQIPEDYPVMTQAQINAAVKKQFSLKNLFKRALSNPEPENED